ncbi:hypothetical protein GCM10022254_49280 [Actinomadura meridiana]|uniref:Uncharacterized protein n=2 Tax=Actinomadura meridiana TaxID=559626 RepID=A0ABP8CCP4_9ACTN
MGWFQRQWKSHPVRGLLLISALAILVAILFETLYVGRSQGRDTRSSDDSSSSESDDRPITPDVLAEKCSKPGLKFANAAAHRGPAPHPMDVIVKRPFPYDEGYKSWYRPAETSVGQDSEWAALEKGTVQLVTCVTQESARKRVSSCRYELDGVDGKSSEPLPMMEQTYKATIYAARTGQTVGEVTFAGHDRECPDTFWSQGLTNLYTEPTDEDLKAALKKFVEG